MSVGLTGKNWCDEISDEDRCVNEVELAEFKCKRVAVFSGSSLYPG